MSGDGKAELLIESADAAFLFLTRKGEQCLLKEELAHDMKAACGKAIAMLDERIRFLEAKNAAAALDKLKTAHRELNAFAEKVETLFEFRGPFVVPPGKDPVQLGNQPVLVARGATPGGSYRHEKPLLINIVQR
jgi:hypothetical protein